MIPSPPCAPSVAWTAFERSGRSSHPVTVLRPPGELPAPPQAHPRHCAGSHARLSVPPPPLPQRVQQLASHSPVVGQFPLPHPWPDAHDPVSFGDRGSLAAPPPVA